MSDKGLFFGAKNIAEENARFAEWEEQKDRADRAEAREAALREKWDAVWRLTNLPFTDNDRREIQHIALSFIANPEAAGNAVLAEMEALRARAAKAERTIGIQARNVMDSARDAEETTTAAAHLAQRYQQQEAELEVLRRLPRWYADRNGHERCCECDAVLFKLSKPDEHAADCALVALDKERGR